MSKSVGVFDKLIVVFGQMVFGGAIGIILSGVLNTVNELSPDYYWKAVGLGLFISVMIIYFGGSKYGFIVDPVKSIIATASIVIGIAGLPIAIEVMVTPEDLSNIDPAILYWGLPMGAFLMTSTSGLGMVDWSSKKKVDVTTTLEGVKTRD